MAGGHSGRAASSDFQLESDLERGRFVPGRKPRERAHRHKAQGQEASQHHNPRAL